MDTDRTQLIDRLKQSNNVLLTVSNNPNVDQLAACIAMTLLLNKMGKHATAVYSGATPSTLEFLKPEDTIEKNTDSLRDFIIALDKSKADKLRYKVEDKLVKIFITPYKTSIGQADLEFSQGDFNVDVVLAIGIHDKEQIDNAIKAHGRILHDAVVMTVNTQAGNNIGTINWVSENASSLSEMLASISDDLQPQLLDPQIATAFLTGIVAETQRFSNEKTSSTTMSISSTLMASGADQQLVATKLEPAQLSSPESSESEDEAPAHDGSIVIEHNPDEEIGSTEELPDVVLDENESQESSNLLSYGDNNTVNSAAEDELPKGLISEPSMRVSAFNANTQPDPLEPLADPMSATTKPDDNPAMTHQDTPLDSLTPAGATSVADIVSSGSTEVTSTANKTLEQIENEVKDQPDSSDSSPNNKPDVELPNVKESQEAATSEGVKVDSSSTPQAGIDDYRAAVDIAINANPDTQRPEPISGLNAQPIDLNLKTDVSKPIETPASAPVNADNSTGGINPSTGLPQNNDMSMPVAQNPANSVPSTENNSPEPPPPVPPPMMPPFDSSSTPSPQ